MSFITLRSLSKFQQQLVNAAKVTNAQVLKSSTLVHGVPNSRPSTVQEASDGGSPNDISFTTKSRQEFAEAYPKLFAKQEHHINQLKAGIPVHRSGTYDAFQTNTFYGFGLVLFVYFMYTYYDMIKNS